MDSTSKERRPGSSNSFKEAALPYLTLTTHIPTPFLSAFLLVHLSAPLLANIGGSSLSSQVMLLGREYYQGSMSEALLVLAPAALHIGAGTLRRLCLPKPFSRASFSVLRVSAYVAGCALPIHFLVNRVYPMISDPPIATLGPSELDYDFVKHGLQTWPWRSALLYGALVGGTLVHAAEGSAILWETYVSKRIGERWDATRMRIRRLQAMAITLLVLSGGLMIWKEDLMVLPSTVSRFNATYLKSFFYN